MGAGASLGGRSASSQPLPTGAEFATEIISALGLNVAAGTPLPYVWDAAALRVGGEAEMVRRFIGPRFHKCVPAPQHLRIATFAWSRIYTFNVDDVLEGAYATEKGRLQTLRIVHFDHQYSEAEADQDQLQLVYLHGAASFPNEPIVFGPPAYAAAATRQHTWWHVLADTFLTQPVIVVGASLREPDFEAYLATKRRSPAPLAATSYFVAPNVDDAVSATCSRLGLVPVRATMTDFLERLAALVPDRVPLSVLNARQISDQGLIDVLQSKPLLSVVARQYVLVGQPDGWPMSDRPPEAFYEGYDPVWEDLRARRDIELQVELRTLAWIQEFQSTPSSRLACICLTGTAGTGKTTALMRLAIGLSEASLRVLYFIAHDRLRDDVLSRVAETLQNELIVVVVDDIASHVEQLRRFMERHRPSDARTVILGAVRSSRKHAVAYHLDDIVPVRFAEMGRLTHDEGLALAKRLRGASKLAQLANHTDAQLATKFTATGDSEWAGQLLVILLETVPGGRFTSRLVSEWGTLDRHERQFYGLVCLAAACGVPARSSVLLKALGGDSSLIMQSLKGGPLASLVNWFDREYLRPRHRVIAERTVARCISREELEDVSRRLAIALAPYVSPFSFKRRTSEARLARELMDADGPILGRIGPHADKWFESIRELWGWTSRYWEQRALVALRTNHYGRARDFAQQAVGIERHRFPLATAGLTHVVSSQRDRGLGWQEREQLFRDGVRMLQDAVREDTNGPLTVHPYDILLTHVPRIARGLYRGSVPTWLADILRDELKRAEERFPRDEHVRRAGATLRSGALHMS